MHVYVDSATRRVIAREGEPTPAVPGFWMDLPGVPDDLDLRHLRIAEGAEYRTLTQAQRDADAAEGQARRADAAIIRNFQAKPNATITTQDLAVNAKAVNRVLLRLIGDQGES